MGRQGTHVGYTGHHESAIFKKKTSGNGVSFFLLVWAIFLLVFQVYIPLSSFLFRCQERLLGNNGSSHHVKAALDVLHEALSSTHHAHRAESFNIEIFSAPKPFVGRDREVNLRAIRSWQRLRPTPKITLLGHDVGYEEVASEYGLGIRRDIDKTFLGVPLFNSMFHIANQSKATVAVIMNGDIILIDDFMSTVKRILTRFEHFLLISARYDLDKLPEEADEDKSTFNEKLRSHALRNGVLHTYGGMDLWAWNLNGPRLFDGEMPHFIFGRGKYDNWLTHETIQAGRRHVIDASEAVMSIHVRHSYSLVTQSGRNLLSAENTAFWSKGKKSKFELFVNIYLSLHSGTYKNQMGSILFAPWRLARCLEPQGTCLVRRARPGSCNCEYTGSSVATQTDPVTQEYSRVIQCGMVSKEAKYDYNIPISKPGDEKEPSSFGMPLTLPSVSERVAVNNTVIVTALNYGYRDIMMNWVCNLRHLNITNFIISAFDRDLYEYAYVRGLPVYLETEVLQGHNSSLSDVAYGTDSFKKLTKLKSRVVLRFLKLGYNVLWSDADIIWFKDPVQNLWAHNVDLAIQSNAPDNELCNAKRRINSGFYLALSNRKVISSFEAVIKFASKSRMSEQPCFYDVLCGKEGDRRVGTNRCIYKGMVLQLLDRRFYPNGMTAGIWDVAAGQILQAFPDLVILHNNWVKGSGAKNDRFKRHGYEFFDSKKGLCRYTKSF